MIASPAQAVLRGRVPDRLPVAPVVGVDHAAARAGVRLRDAMSDPLLMAEVVLEAYELYEADLVVLFSDVAVEAEALGAGVAWPDGAPPRVETPCGSAALRPLDPRSDGRLPVVIAAARIVIDAVGERMPVLVSMKGPFSLAALTTGFESLLLDAVESPEDARATLDAAAECQVAYARAIVETGGIPLIGDPFASGSVLGPDHFEALALPGLRRLVTEVHDAGSLAALHVCGDVNPVLEPLLSVGADLLHLEEADLDRAAASGAVLMGGVPTEVLLSDDEEEIRAAVRAAIRAIPDPDRFVLATVCDVPTHARPERVALLGQEARLHR